MAEALILRHVAATEVTTTEHGWEVYGASPSLTSRQRGEFAAVLPFAGNLQSKQSCPWLAGTSVEHVLAPDNYRDLRFAVSRQFDHIAFSVWGGILDPARTSPPWRVMTYSLLMSPESFESVGGHPEGLLATLVEEQGGGWSLAPSTWFAESSRYAYRDFTPLPELAIPEGQEEALGRDRRARLVWMSSELAEQMGGVEHVAHCLAAAYAALAEILKGSTYRHVVVPDAGDGTARGFVYLVWSSLPLEDRKNITFHSDVRSADELHHQIAVMRGHSIPQPIPSDWINFHPKFIPPLGELEEGFLQYARSVCGLGEPFAGLDRAPDLEGYSLLTERRHEEWFVDKAFVHSYQEDPGLARAVDRILWHAENSEPEREGLIAALAEMILAGLREQLGNLQPAEAVDQFQANWRTLGKSTLVRRVCGAALDILGSGAEEWDRYVGGLLALRCVNDPDLPAILPWFVDWVRESPDSIKERLAADGYGRDLLQAAAIAISSEALAPEEAMAKIARPAFRASPEPALLLDAVRVPTSPETLTWVLTVLEEAIDAVPQEVVVEVGAALFSKPAVMEIPDAGRAVAKRAHFLRLLATHAPLELLESILALARPDFDVTGQVLLDRLNRDGCDDNIDRWARLLGYAGLHPIRHANTSLEENPYLAAIFTSEVWRWAAPEWYEVLAGWLEQPRALEGRADFAVQLVTSRGGQGDLPPAEVRLVGTAIRVLGADGRLSREHGIALARASNRSSKATLQWALSWSSAGGARDDPRHDVLEAFSRQAAERVRQQARGPTDLMDGVRVAWAEHRLSGRESFVSAVLADRHASPGHRLLELLETCPPSAVYSSTRAWGERASPFRDLDGREATALRSRMMLVAPSLSRLYDGPEEGHRRWGARLVTRVRTRFGRRGRPGHHRRVR